MQAGRRKIDTTHPAPHRHGQTAEVRSTTETRRKSLPPGLPLMETAVAWRRADTSPATKQLLGFFKEIPHSS
jgi:hypothetical protein